MANLFSHNGCWFFHSCCCSLWVPEGTSAAAGEEARATTAGRLKTMAAARVQPQGPVSSWGSFQHEFHENQPCLSLSSTSTISSSALQLLVPVSISTSRPWMLCC